MASPLYFFPGIRLESIVKNNRLDLAFLAGRGVAPAFAGIRDVRSQMSVQELRAHGPGNHSGALLTVVAGDVPLRLGFFPDFQTWHERPAGCEAWVGLDREYPPMPANLAHAVLMRGHDVELSDGNFWHVPIVRSPFDRDAMGRSSLPRDFSYDQSGRAISTRQSSSDQVWELSAAAWDHTMCPAQMPSLNLSLLLELCVSTIGLNYRFGKVEQELLRPINSANWEAISDALLDVPLLEERVELEKKNQAALQAGLPSASPGVED